MSHSTAPCGINFRSVHSQARSLVWLHGVKYRRDQAMTVTLQDHKQFLGTGSVDVLEAERDRLSNSCYHLERSNVELQEAIQESGPDPDFKQAIQVGRCACTTELPVYISHTFTAQENIVALAHQRARIISLQQEIDKAKTEDIIVDEYVKAPAFIESHISASQQLTPASQLNADHSVATESTGRASPPSSLQQTEQPMQQTSLDNSDMDTDHNDIAMNSSLAAPTTKVQYCADQQQSMWL